MKWIYVALIAMASLLVSNGAVAYGPQPLALTMTGGINSIGGQNYILGQHGSVDYASVMGQTLNPHGSLLAYSLTADVVGASVSGHGTLHLVGTTAGGKSITLDARISIQNMVPAESFQGSAIPSAFLGLLTGTFSTGGVSSSVSLPVSVVSPFINTYGGPIVLASLDTANSIELVSAYQFADIFYSNVQVFTVSVTGTVGGTPVTAGSATLSTWAMENLRAGTEVEAGSIAFQGMNPSMLDSSGFYSGSSVIPSSSNCLSTYGFSPCTTDCTAYLPLLMGAPDLNTGPLPSSGLCTITGFISSGTFHTHGSHAQISGSYRTVWDIPSVSFGISIPPPFGGSTITGSVSSWSTPS